MSHQVPGNGAAYPVSFLAPDDGDPKNAASINVGFEALADRTEWLKIRMDRVEPIANLAALTAIAAPTNGMVRLVKRVGFFIFDSASGTSSNGVTVLVADDTTFGRWVFAGYDLIGAAQGLAGLNASSQLIVPGTGYPTFAATRSRVRSVPVTNFLQTAGGVATRAKGATFSHASYIAATGDVTASSGVLTFQNNPTGTMSTGISICLDPFVHNGARLVTLRASVQAASGHAAMSPLTNCSIGVFRKPLTGSTLSAMRSISDFYTDPSATTATYQAQHYLDYNGLDSNNTIDTSQYSYFVQIWDEFGTYGIPGLKVFGIELTHDSIADMRPA